MSGITFQKSEYKYLSSKCVFLICNKSAHSIKICLTVITVLHATQTGASGREEGERRKRRRRRRKKKKRRTKKKNNNNYNKRRRRERSRRNIEISFNYILHRRICILLICVRRILKAYFVVYQFLFIFALLPHSHGSTANFLPSGHIKPVVTLLFIIQFEICAFCYEMNVYWNKIG